MQNWKPKPSNKILTEPNYSYIWHKFSWNRQTTTLEMYPEEFTSIWQHVKDGWSFLFRAKESEKCGALFALVSSQTVVTPSAWAVAVWDIIARWKLMWQRHTKFGDSVTAASQYMRAEISSGSTTPSFFKRPRTGFNAYTETGRSTWRAWALEASTGKN